MHQIPQDNNRDVTSSDGHAVGRAKKAPPITVGVRPHEEPYTDVEPVSYVDPVKQRQWDIEKMSKKEFNRLSKKEKEGIKNKREVIGLIVGFLLPVVSATLGAGGLLSKQAAFIGALLTGIPLAAPLLFGLPFQMLVLRPHDRKNYGEEIDPECYLTPMAAGAVSGFILAAAIMMPSFENSATGASSPATSQENSISTPFRDAHGSTTKGRCETLAGIVGEMESKGLSPKAANTTGEVLQLLNQTNNCGLAGRIALLPN